MWISFIFYVTVLQLLQMIQRVTLTSSLYSGLRKGQSEIQAFGRKSQQPFWEKAHRSKQGRGDALPSLPGS